MHVRKKDQASITVFASLSLLLVSSFLLVLLEAARVHGLSSYAKMVRMQSLESLFSNYNRHIFDEYGIFCGCGIVIGADALKENNFVFIINTAENNVCISDIYC